MNWWYLLLSILFETSMGDHVKPLNILLSYILNSVSYATKGDQGQKFRPTDRVEGQATRVCDILNAWIDFLTFDIWNNAWIENFGMCNSHVVIFYSPLHIWIFSAPSPEHVSMSVQLKSAIRLSRHFKGRILGSFWLEFIKTNVNIWSYIQHRVSMQGLIWDNIIWIIHTTW